VTDRPLQEPNRLTAGDQEASLRLLRRGLASLWLVDAALQLQPGMFRMDMISDIMAPAATGQPAWLAHSIAWSIRLIEPHLVPFNWGVVALQALLGLCLLSGQPRLVRTALWASLLWSALVWWFGEGLGQLLTGSASFLAGAPGSVLLYGLLAALLLLPPERIAVLWRGRSLPLASVLAAALFLAGALLQLNPLFFSGLGLASLFGQGAMMAQPTWVVATLRWAADAAGVQPVLWNGILVLVLAGAGVALLFEPGSRATALTATLALLLVWWFGQDLGGLFTGMATDPNTAAPLALLVWVGYRSSRRDAVSQATREPSLAG
jgi:hypothetical protein